jgi:hypothetical protein
MVIATKQADASGKISFSYNADQAQTGFEVVAKMGVLQKRKSL